MSSGTYLVFDPAAADTLVLVPQDAGQSETWLVLDVYGVLPPLFSQAWSHFTPRSAAGASFSPGSQEGNHFTPGSRAATSFTPHSSADHSFTPHSAAGAYRA